MSDPRSQDIQLGWSQGSDSRQGFITNISSFRCIAHSGELSPTHQTLCYARYIIDYYLGFYHLWHYFNWSEVRVCIGRRHINIILIQLQELAPTLISGLLSKQTFNLRNITDHNRITKTSTSLPHLRGRKINEVKAYWSNSFLESHEINLSRIWVL